MKPKDFVNKYINYAKESEKKTGINYKAILAQAALESGWGESAPGNMFFGVKDTDGINGNEQLLTTTEYSKNPNLKFPVIISITNIIKNNIKMFKYTIKDYFRKYSIPEQSFTDHCNFLIKNKRYTRALMVKSDANKFIDEIALAGYATDPNYAKTLKSIVLTIEKYI